MDGFGNNLLGDCTEGAASVLQAQQQGAAADGTWEVPAHLRQEGDAHEDLTSHGDTWQANCWKDEWKDANKAVSAAWDDPSSPAEHRSKEKAVAWKNRAEEWK